jgi:MFS family permease
MDGGAAALRTTWPAFQPQRPDVPNDLVHDPSYAHACRRRSYDLGVIGGALLALSSALSITSDVSKEAIVGSAKLGAVAGAFLGGALMLRYGRRTAIAAQALAFTSGPLIMVAASGPP